MNRLRTFRAARSNRRPDTPAPHHDYAVISAIAFAVFTIGCRDTVPPRATPAVTEPRHSLQQLGPGLIGVTAISFDVQISTSDSSRGRQRVSRYHVDRSAATGG